MTPSVPQRSYLTPRQLLLLKILKTRIERWTEIDVIRGDVEWYGQQLPSRARTSKLLRDMEDKHLTQVRRVNNNYYWHITDLGLEALRENA